MTTWSGWAIDDRPGLLARLAAAGIALAHEVVVCDHVTLSFPDTAAPAPATAVVVGVAADDRIQALVVEVDGTRIRPDGRIYHVTLSRRPDVADVKSNAMLRAAAQAGDVAPAGPWPITTTPILRSV
jgi:hypothetical protein